MWNVKCESKKGKDRQLKYTFKRTNQEFEHIEIKEEIWEKWKGEISTKNYHNTGQNKKQNILTWEQDRRQKTVILSHS